MATGYYIRALEHSKTHENYLQLAVCQFKAGNVQEALVVINQALKIKSQCIESLYLKLECLGALNKIREAAAFAIDNQALIFPRLKNDTQNPQLDI